MAKRMEEMLSVDSSLVLELLYAAIATSWEATYRGDGRMAKSIEDMLSVVPSIVLELLPTMLPASITFVEQEMVGHRPHCLQSSHRRHAALSLHRTMLHTADHRVKPAVGEVLIPPTLIV